ncbi:cell wall glucanase [Coccidioides immitis RS]|uniref:Cell wall glucanase n=4 Tax=Coccidioides TaxID=5500 RepID=J3KDS1_COCIM|nr:cell wall glucanase [Coccidioides immitis RS]XP_003071690.1 Glycosyl hydrolases family 16 protein [Coccidioides posadasii C735 delta SOWgp]KMM70049.1 UTR2 protein [Coccidioides posadasii RMSCC 3488]KMP04710.1 UTR2 protein [Coccidioides immitis RMSCC 2394]EAS33538.3 cell wall glucanase [Coccidioides immitis RS]EER29545.1 Glycosyl hydrolases family 16 protein [Coccidioides posadasii C735 delta SOWgp]|eukprot:XP_003071690.1 Glycosyl hydrolases family 16 protein [Coccidioides posadasii C735 delta SOWgp]
MTRLLAYALALALSSQAFVAAKPQKCGPSQKCPESAPCCSQYGDCGSGAYCLGGCDPKWSFAIDSCLPAPVCKSKTYRWDNLDGVAPNTKYLGDASKADWVSSGEPLTSDGSLILTMAPDTVGTLMANNHYMWYGKTTARLKTSRGKGVVTAFILLSDMKDEIDFEFVGVDLQNAQTNYYFQGITDYTNGQNASASDTFDEFHTYEIDWKPESITWSIDGKPVRVKKRSETFNKTSNQYAYPQTPSRVQLSLWPAGLPSNGEGTIEWAGGLVDWNHEDIKNHGYYYALFDEVTVECYDPPKDAKVEGSKSYIFTDEKGTEDTVKITNKNTVLKSFLGNGRDTDKDYPSASGTRRPSQTSDLAVVPGLSGAGPGADGNRGDSDGSDGGSPNGGNRPNPTDFSQGGDRGNESSGASPQNEQVLKGSLFAVLVALVVLVTM